MKPPPTPGTVPVDQVPHLDLVICGSVAVNPDGVRIGKGAGYADIELGLLTEVGLLVSVTVLAASWQDRDGAKTALLSVYLFTPIRYVFADQGFAGRLVEWAARTLSMVIDIVRKPAGQRGFEVHPKRWVVERTPCLADRPSAAGP